MLLKRKKRRLKMLELKKPKRDLVERLREWVLIVLVAIVSVSAILTILIKILGRIF